MRLAIFDDLRLGLVDAEAATLVDVSVAVPGHDADSLGASWWVRLCRDLPELRPRLLEAATRGSAIPLESVRLRPAALNPSKIVACASNYAAHVSEMTKVQARVGAPMEAWMAEFDVFLKAPSSLAAPEDDIVLPRTAIDAGLEVHHECELAVVIGRGGAAIAAADAMQHVAGYSIGLDITVRGSGDRSRRKSYDTFTPLGPWLTTADEVADPQALEITLALNGVEQQRVSASGMTVPITDIIARSSACMRLEPGDVILTGAPPGVGEIHAGDRVHAAISQLGAMSLGVRAATP